MCFVQILKVKTSQLFRRPVGRTVLYGRTKQLRPITIPSGAAISSSSSSSSYLSSAAALF